MRRNPLGEPLEGKPHERFLWGGAGNGTRRTLHGHEGGNPGDRQGRPCKALPRQSLTRQAGFREIKQEIGSAETQTRNPDAVTNHLNFCLAATTPI